MSNLVDNPCTTLPPTENWLADYPNLRCYRNYIYDSGWVYNDDIYSPFYVFDTDGNKGFRWGLLAPQCYSYNTSCVSSGYTYHKGVNVLYTEVIRYKIKRTQLRTEYKNFSEL